jgi:ATP-dependent protease ClpP protease subunit
MEQEIWITGEIDEQSLEKMRLDLSKIPTNCKTLIVNIDSNGGYVLCGKSMYAMLEVLKSKGTQIICVGWSMVYSAATFPFMVGDKRIIHNFTEFLAHPPYQAIAGDAQTLERTAKELRNTEDFIVSLYASKTSIDKTKILDFMYENRVIGYKETLDLGFATELAIIQKNININININKHKAVALWQNNVKMKKNQLTMSQAFFVAMGTKTKASCYLENAKKKATKNMLVKTTSGQELYVYAENEELVGSVVVLASEGQATETPAPDGEHKVDVAGVVYTIEVTDGVIISAVSEEEDKSMPAKEEETYDAKEVKEALNTITTSMLDLKKRLDVFENVANEINSFKVDLANVVPAKTKNEQKDAGFESSNFEKIGTKTKINFD